MLPSQGTDQYQPLDQPLDLLHYPGGGSKCRMNFFETVLSFLVRSGPMKVHTSCHLSSLLHEAFFISSDDGVMCQLMLNVESTTRTFTNA